MVGEKVFRESGFFRHCTEEYFSEVDLTLKMQRSVRTNCWGSERFQQAVERVTEALKYRASRFEILARRG